MEYIYINIYIIKKNGNNIIYKKQHAYLVYIRHSIYFIQYIKIKTYIMFIIIMCVRARIYKYSIYIYTHT